MNVKRRYSGLGFLALLFKVFAWIALIASIAFAVWFWFQDYSVRILDFAPFRVPNWTGSLFLPFGIFTFIQLYVIGSLISLLIDVEYNTRANATVTSELVKAVESLRMREAAQPAPSVMSPAPPPPPPPPPAEEMQPAPAPPPTQETQPLVSPEASAPPPPPEPESESLPEPPAEAPSSSPEPESEPASPPEGEEPPPPESAS